MPLYLEDLFPGQRFESRPRTLRAEDAVRFAREFDPQPFHLEQAAAERSLFGALTVSGWHTAAFSMRLFVEEGPPIAAGMVGLGGEISWPRPTRPGDTLRLVVEILEVRPTRSRPDRGIVTFRNETINQRDEVVQVFLGKMLVPRRPG
ncbi:MAG TPA: MaoC family dehydratase [Gemmatimonadales bacterium]|nr:MaoC family dehydratase [Gemmatimonadales bacterium]